MITTDTDLELMSFEEACSQVVTFLKQTSPMASWSVTRVAGGRQTQLAIQDDAYGKVTGDSHAWSDSLCQYMADGSAPAIAPDAMAIPLYASSGAARAMPIKSYAGATIRAGDGTLFGTICGLDPERGPEGALSGASGLRLLADLLGRVLEASTLRAQAELRTRQAQEAHVALARSEAAHRLLVTGTRDAISRHDISGELTYVSPAGQAMFGWSAEEMRGCGWRDLLHPDDLAGAATRGATSDSGEATFRMRHGDGHWVWVESTWTAIRDDEGRPVEMLVCSRDITARRARESESHRESLQRMSDGLAHGINTPMQYVGDNARFLAEAFEDLMELVGPSLGSKGPGADADPLLVAAVTGREAEAADLQTEVLSAVSQTLVGIDRVASIVRAMKLFSHPGSGTHVLTDLNEALTATVTVARNQIDRFAELDLELGELPPVRCDAASLNLAFMALLGNAADAVGETGRRGVVRVSTAVDGPEVLVSVTDTGVGIPKDVRSRVFEPFFTTKDISRGTGQGLPLARSVVQDAHGGTLSFTTAPGVGTTMTIRLPIAGPGAVTG